MLAFSIVTLLACLIIKYRFKEDLELEEKYAKEGFSAYLSKPIEYKKMEMIVKDLLPPEKII